MTIKEQITDDLRLKIKDLGIVDVQPIVEYPADPKHGDYSSNIALIAAKKLGKNPMELAESIATDLRLKIKDLGVEKVEVVKPGFINFWATNDALVNSLTSLDNSEKAKTSLTGKKVLVEFAHPNTHKAFHIGHLRNIVTGESVARLLDAAGVSVIRGNYQGDVGMHIAKCLYGVLKIPDYKSQIVNLKDARERVDFLGSAYSQGSKAFEEDETAKKEILDINNKIYSRDPSVWEIYQTTRQWSLDYFELIYKRLGSHFDRYYFESEVYESGKKYVLDGLKKGIFEKSNGAIIFPGKKLGLHDRVFITGEGNPTYEAKEMGLGTLEFSENDLDLVIHVVGPEQTGYFQVVFEALALLFPETREKEQHKVYGWVKLKEGKMSSRTGNVILGEWLIDEAKKEIQKILEKNESNYTEAEKDDISEKVAVAAVKYSFLRVSTQQEIAYDLKESVSFEGNSGPYIQYVFARTQSVLAKAGATINKSQSTINKPEAEERELLRLLAKYGEVVQEASERLAPNIVCTYLFDLAQAFNLFYQKCPILKSESEIRDFRLFLTKQTGETIKNGLNLLGIDAPVKM